MRSEAEAVASIPERRLALSVQGLTYGFPGAAPLFDGLSFDAAEGEFVTLLAASGLGKTTLFRLLAGLLKPQAGTIRIGTHADRKPENPEHSPASPGKGRVAYMPQRDCLMPWRSVLDNAALGLELAGVSRQEARKRVRELLPAFGLADAETKRPYKLSGGMRQRVSFLRSMLAGGDVLLLDEPFSALDAMTRMEMQLWLLSVWERERKTILFVTHDIDEALLLSDRVLVASSSPVSALHEIPVRLRRPRRYEDVLDGTFADAKRKALALLGRREGGGSR
ncbi:ABC transporter ATP-binding protein [Cohnella zeiphila]|uniref:ABC transporter ATP-binding protein n=1 Tax=Cohnella zeiphila TaxID=2761120 RepID=A0A7X0SQF7_9BACL|nr:ABC transporter ATP-binding protein [Cohnella zeiphila]MBB6734252.1 ABC transporter ATP-binding protein [Cohnella zeiphila]